MRSDKAIKNMMELLLSPSWSQGMAAWRLLDEYHSGTRPSSEDDLLADLEREVAFNWKVLKADDIIQPAVAQIRVQVIIWMLENTDLLKELSVMPVLSSYIENRLRIICDHYGLEIPVGQSEEE